MQSFIISASWAAVIFFMANVSVGLLHHDPSVVIVYADDHPICVGTLLKPDMVLTSAHCLFPYKKALQDDAELINLGIRKHNAAVGTKGGQGHIIKVLMGIIHPQYQVLDSYKDGNDIAILLLPDDIAERSESVLLPTGRSTLSDAESTEEFLKNVRKIYNKCWIVGFLKDEETGELSNLKTTEIDFLSSEKCGQYMPHVLNNRNVFCAANTKCDWMAGSLMLCSPRGTMSRRGELVGIQSYTYVPCNENRKPMAFTSIPHYREWIQNFIR